MHAPLPVAQLLFAVGVVEREHRRGVRHLDEALARLAAHPLGGRIGGDQLGMLGFERLEFVHQPVEFGVADLRIVEHVIAVLVIADLVAQRFDLLLHIFAGGHEQLSVAGSQLSVSRCTAFSATAARGWHGLVIILKLFTPMMDISVRDVP